MLLIFVPDTLHKVTTLAYLLLLLSTIIIEVLTSTYS